MKVIAFGDIHGNLDAVKPIYSKIESADLLIISGDLTTYSNYKDAKKIIETLKRINNNIIAVMGNLDDRSVLKYLEDENLSIHGKGRLIDNVGFFGIGGSNSTPFNTPTEYSEPYIKELLERGYEDIKDADVKVMVTHMPPYDTKTDILPNGQHVGSRSVRNFITNYLPDLNITGHIHEAVAEDTVGKTKIINPGEFKKGGYIFFDTSDTSSFFRSAKLLNAYEKEDN